MEESFQWACAAVAVVKEDCCVEVVPEIGTSCHECLGWFPGAGEFGGGNGFRWVDKTCGTHRW